MFTMNSTPTQTIKLDNHHLNITQVMMKNGGIFKIVQCLNYGWTCRSYSGEN